MELLCKFKIDQKVRYVSKDCIFVERMEQYLGNVGIVRSIAFSHSHHIFKYRVEFRTGVSYYIFETSLKNLKKRIG